MARSSASRIQLDWFNVTYRSVFGIILLVVLAAAGGVSYWYYFSVYQPREGARDAIARAEQRFGEATSLRGQDHRLVEVVESAQVALQESRGLYSTMRYEDSRGAAIRSETLSLQAIAMIKGQADTQMVRFYRLEGDVRVKKVGQFSWESANPKAELRLGDQIKTSSSGSAQLIYFDGTITTIQPGSLLEIRELYENPVTKVRRVREELTFGELKASTQKKNVDGSFHEVAAGKIAARSEDESEFRVTADEGTKAASFDVFQGQVQVASASKRESLVAGERIRARSDGHLSPKEALPPVPVLLSPRDQRVFILDAAGPQEVTLTWDEVSGAERYKLLISDKALFTNPLYDAVRQGTNAVIESVPEGSYHWKVAAVSDSGVTGPYCAPRRFRVSSQKIRDRSDTEPPGLEITEFVAVGAMVIVNGRTEPGATLWVDNEKIDVYDDGTFYAVVRMRREGLNELRFVAQDNSGNETEVLRSTYVEIF